MINTKKKNEYELALEFFVENGIFLNEGMLDNLKATFQNGYNTVKPMLSNFGSKVTNFISNIDKTGYSGSAAQTDTQAAVHTRAPWNKPSTDPNSNIASSGQKRAFAPQLQKASNIVTNATKSSFITPQQKPSNIISGNSKAVNTIASSQNQSNIT